MQYAKTLKLAVALTPNDNKNMENQKEAPPITEIIETKFKTAYSDAEIHIENVGDSEVLEGTQENGNLIRLYRPIIETDEKIGGGVFVVEIFYSVYMGAEEQELLRREFQVGSSLVAEIVAIRGNDIFFRELGFGEESDLTLLIEKATFDWRF